MMSFLPIAILLVLLYLIEVLYFRIAGSYNIIDKPNERSSHNAVTLRGGGIIFTLSVILWYLFYSFQFPFFFIGLLAITLISFIDDIITLDNKIRLAVHLLAVILLFFQWNLFAFPWYWIIIATVFVIGTINAYNFMDGINGITGSYSLLTITTLYYINEKIVRFTNTNLLIIVGLSLVVFIFFNFRTKAKCFAGDVGSVSIAFVLVFSIGQLILVTHNFGYLLLLLIYGLDTATTVFFRKLRNENIFIAHRSHLYQYLANQLKWNHLWVATLYFILQLLCNVILIFLLKDSLAFALLFAVLMIITFLSVRMLVEGKDYLLKNIDHEDFTKNG
jgi:UDP-N-acetylmuramyl pentapeptide phosphotransferase/UDP-N-acetylglucosamine-1-phosphate transferase